MRRHANAAQLLGAAGNLGIVAVCLVFSAPLSAQDRKPEATFEGHTASVESLSFSPDGKTLASGGRDHSIRLWDVATGRTIATMKEERPYLWDSVAFSPDGKSLATGGWFDKMGLWDDGLRKSTRLLDEMQQCPPPMLVFSPDGKTLVSGGVCRGKMKLFDVATGKFKADLVSWEGANAEGVVAMAFSPDSKTLVSVGRPDEIKLWDVGSGKNTVTRRTTSELYSAAFSPDAKTLATAVWVDLGDRYVAKHIKFWVVETGKEIVTLEGHALDVICLTFSPDGKTLASGCEDGTVKLWDVARAKETASFKAHPTAVRRMVFTPDGKTLASGGADKAIKLWDMSKVK